MSLRGGLEKIAFFGFGESKKTPEPKIEAHHVKKILPHFRKAEVARKKMLAGKMSDVDYGEAAMPFVNHVALVEAESGIHNERLYKHMYDKYGGKK